MILSHFPRRRRKEQSVTEIERKLNIADDLVNAFNDGYKQGKIDAVVRGRWVGKTPETRHEYVYPLNYKCSNCGFLAKYDGWRYCPNCGAKMDGGTDNG